MWTVWIDRSHLHSMIDPFLSHVGLHPASQAGQVPRYATPAAKPDVVPTQPPGRDPRLQASGTSGLVFS